MSATLLTRAMQLKQGATTLVEWLGSGAVVVGRETAQKRADKCLTCPKHSETQPITEAIAGAIRRQVELKNHLEMRVAGEKRLHVCTACNCAMKLKVHLPKSKILPEPEERANFDVNCWLLDDNYD